MSDPPISQTQLRMKPEKLGRHISWEGTAAATLRGGTFFICHPLEHQATQGQHRGCVQSPGDGNRQAVQERRLAGGAQLGALGRLGDGGKGEDQSLSPSTHMVILNHLLLQFQRIQCSPLAFSVTAFMRYTYILTCRQSIHSHKIKIKKTLVNK